MLRTDAANHVLGLRLNVWTSLLVFAGSAFAFWRLGRRAQGGDEQVSGKAGPPTDEPAMDEPAPSRNPD